MYRFEEMRESDGEQTAVALATVMELRGDGKNCVTGSCGINCFLIWCVHVRGAGGYVLKALVSHGQERQGMKRIVVMCHAARPRLRSRV